MPSFSSYDATVAHYHQADLHRRFHLNPMNLLAPLPADAPISLEVTSSPLLSSSSSSSLSSPLLSSSTAAPPITPPPAVARPPPPSSPNAALGSSIMFSSSSQSAMLLPAQDGPPLLFPAGSSAGHKVAAAAVPVGGSQDRQQAPIMIGPDGDASLPEEKAMEGEEEDVPMPTKVASSQFASATSARVATSSLEESSSTAVASSSPATTHLPPTTSASPPATWTTTRVQPTTLTATTVSTESAPTSVLTSLVVLTNTLTRSQPSGSTTTVVSTFTTSASIPSAPSLSDSSSIPLASTSLLAGLAQSSVVSSSLPSSSSTSLSSSVVSPTYNDTSKHSKAPLIIILSLSALVLVATLATSLSWMVRHRHSRDSFWSSFCCCFPSRGRRSSASSDVSYEHDGQSDYYEAYGPEAGSVRRASAESQLRSEKFYGMNANRGSGMGRSSSLDGGMGGNDAGGMERRRSIKRGIAESELEDGFNLHDAQTLGESQALGRKDSTFLDPANGRHLTPVLSPLGSPLATNPSPSSSPRNPFAVPALMTPTPEVVSSLSGDSPYPTSRPLPGNFIVANYVPGDITDVEGSSLRSPPRAPITASGYETDVAAGKIGEPRDGHVSRPRFLSLGEQGGLDVPWHSPKSSHSASSSVDGSIATPPHESAILSLTQPSPFLSHGSILAPPPAAHISPPSPYNNPAAAAIPLPSTPFPDAPTGNAATDTWAATLRTNLFAAISNMTGSGAGPALDPEKGLGEKGEMMDKYTAFPAGVDGFGRRKSLKEGVSDQYPSPFSRSSSNASSVPSRYGGASNLHHTPSVASSLYSTTTDAASERYPSMIAHTPRPKRLRGKKVIANGTPAPSSMGLGVVSSDDGSTWNGLGGRSDNEAWERGGRMA